MDIVEEEVNWSIKAKYLGVILGQGLTLKDHVDYLVDMTKKSMGKLIGRRSKLELKIKLLGPSSTPSCCTHVHSQPEASSERLLGTSRTSKSTESWTKRKSRTSWMRQPREHSKS